MNVLIVCVDVIVASYAQAFLVVVVQVQFEDCTVHLIQNKRHVFLCTTTYLLHDGTLPRFCDQMRFRYVFVVLFLMTSLGNGYANNSQLLGLWFLERSKNHFNHVRSFNIVYDHSGRLRWFWHVLSRNDDVCLFIGSRVEGTETSDLLGSVSVGHSFGPTSQICQQIFLKPNG